MDDSQYQYLDDERKKLWQELRQTQENVTMLMSVLSSSMPDEQKALAQITMKAARAYARIKERDAQTAQFVEHIDAAKTLGEECREMFKTLNGWRDRLAISEQEVSNARKEFDAKLSGLEDRANTLKERERVIEEFVNQSDATTDEAQAQLDAIEEKHAEIDNKYQEIAKVHRLLFGFTKDNGEVVEGKKQDLENTYDELEQQIDKTQADAEAFEKEYKEKCSTFLASAKAEADALSSKVRGLLPDAMTAGLSSAYLENRETEEQEQQKQMKLFSRCIWCMMGLALLPIGLNLWLWLHLHKDLLDILAMLPREVTCILPIYIPLFWLAIFANKRVNLSKRLIEEYKHKEAVSKTYEGLTRQIAEIDDEESSRELQKRLLFNTIMLSEKNPGELIKNFNRPDNPLLDMLNQGSRLADAVDKLSRFPGIEKILAMAKPVDDKRKAPCEDAKASAKVEDEE